MKKQYKQMYKLSKKPQIIHGEKQVIISLEGTGDPNNNPEFSANIGALYKLSYSFRMSYRNQPIANYSTYTVGPLEGIWTTVDDRDFKGEKNRLKYRIFIVQPNFITHEVFLQYQNKLKLDNPLIGEIEYSILDEGLVGQITHIGSYDDEEETVKLLVAAVAEQGYKIDPGTHHEIYISDFRKCASENLKTIIRYQLRKINN